MKKTTKKKSMKTLAMKSSTRKPRLDFSQRALANVEQIIGGKLSNGIPKKR